VNSSRIFLASLEEFLAVESCKLRKESVGISSLQDPGITSAVPGSYLPLRVGGL